MGAVIEALAWDTEFFGVPIGKVDLDGLDEGGLAAIDTEARALGLTCLYGSLDPSDLAASVRAQRAGWLLVETAILYDARADEPRVPEPDGLTIRIGGPDDLALLREGSDGLASWSRFACDPRFGLDAARRLQWAWIERAARSTTGEDELVVAEIHGEFAAFITRTTRGQKRVDSAWAMAKGSGAMRSLLQDVRDWGDPEPLVQAGPIAARNVPCHRMISYTGFRIRSVRYLFHRWLDEGTP